MKNLIRTIFVIILSMVNLEACMFHQQAPIAEEWQKENLNPFDELMISWNAIRRSEGNFHFYVKVKTEEWSPWLLYASWGSEGQSSFLIKTEESPIRVYQDTLEITEGEKATAFQIKIVAEGSSHLDDIYGLHVYTNSDKGKPLQKPDSSLSIIILEVPGISQMNLNHLRHTDLCSPTSTTAVTRYLANNTTLDAAEFAEQVWDSGFDIFGNWVFNIAQASTYLGPDWNCWVERLNSFEDIHQYLQQNIPVIVSVRGPLFGSAQPYAQGHLIAVVGYDALNERVICMDPAFPRDSETHVSYDHSDFIQAWNRRGNVAYIFNKNER